METPEDKPGSVEWLDEPETLEGGPVRRSRLKIAVVTAAVAAVLTATSLILHANHEFGPWPDSRTATVGSVDWRKTLPGTGVGMWTTPDSVVVATESGLTAYALSQGKRLWSWAPPAGQGLCAMSPTTSRGLGVVAYGALGSSGIGLAAGLPCTVAQAIDVGTGNALWPEPVDLTQSGEGAILPSLVMHKLSISDGFVVAPYGERGFMSLDAATGARLWTSSQHPELGGDSSSCLFQGAQTLDAEIYVIPGGPCTAAGVSGPAVAVYNAAKFASPRVLPLPADDSPHCAPYARTLFATAGAVLLTCDTFSGRSYPAYAIPSGTAQLIPLAVQETGGIATADVASGAGQLGLAGGFVSADDLLVESSRVPASTAALTGFDLSTGTPLWRHSFPAGARLYLLGPGGGGVQGVQITGDGWALLSISPTSGTTSPPVPLDSTALSGAGINRSFDDAVVGSDVVVCEFDANVTIVVSTL